MSNYHQVISGDGVPRKRFKTKLDRFLAEERALREGELEQALYAIRQRAADEWKAQR